MHAERPHAPDHHATRLMASHRRLLPVSATELGGAGPMYGGESALRARASPVQLLTCNSI